MDPITQGALGAAAAQLVVGPRLGRRTWLYGCLGGMAADLDVLIRSSVDPMVALTYHRHFTHSLAFVPVGGLVVALPWLFQRSLGARRRPILAATTVGYATHALLDCCTSYGTLYGWPFLHDRVAWSFISIVDLLYTVPLIVGVWLAARRGSRRPVLIASLVAHAYMALCGLQKLRALAVRDHLAQRRGHVVEDSLVQNLLLSQVGWRSLYEADGRIWVDAIYTPWLASAVVREGTSTATAGVDDLPTAVRDDAKTRGAFDTFRWFASGWVTVAPDPEGARVCDVRYSAAAAELAPLWCLRLRPGAEPPVERVDRRFDRTDEIGALFEASFFAPPDARALD